jgi:Flp pilus assembly protein TadD
VGSHELAADRFAEIVDADPLAHYAHFGLGLSRARLGDRITARRHLRMAVFLKPESDDYRRALRRLEAA